MRALGKDVMVITGIMTNCCDLCTAYYAGSKDYKVILCFDMTRGSNPSDRSCRRTHVLPRYIGLNTNSEELLSRGRAQKA